jgi:hypothetical protein
VTQVVGQTKIYQDNTKVTVDFGGNHIATWDGTQIKLDYEGKQTVTVNADSIDLKHNSGAETLLNSDGVKHTFNGHFVQVTSGGVQMG